MSSHPGTTVGVVIVHGVGDPKAGETLDTLVESLCGANPALRIESTARHVLRGNKYDSEIIVPHRRLTDSGTGTTLLMSEVFWGDVGRVSDSWWGSLSAVMSLAMGLHALIFAGGGIGGSAAPQSSSKAPHLPHFTDEKLWFRAAFWTAFIGAYHIKGVLMPLAVALLTLGACSMFLSNDSRPPSWLTLFALPVVGMLSLFVPPPGSWMRPAPPLKDLDEPPDRWVMPTLAAGIWCVVGYVVPTCGALIAMSRLGAAAGPLVGLLLTVLFGLGHTLVVLFTVRKCWRKGWLVYFKLMAFGAASIPWTYLTVLLSLHEDPSQVMSLLGPVLMSAYHVALGFAAFWVLVVGACCLVGSFDPSPGQRNSGKVIFLGYSFELSLWVSLATTLACFAWRLPDHKRLKWLDVDAYGPGSWFPLVPVLFVAGLAVSLVVWLRIREHRQTKAHVSRPPRVDTIEPAIAALVGSWPLPLMATTMALACLVAVAADLNVIGRLPLGAAAISAVLLFAIPVVRWLRTPLHQGLDLATDVTEYFRGRSWASSTQHRTDERLKARFTSVVEDIVAKVDRLVVVAHSQGTVIAVDALRNWPDGKQLDPGKMVLLTMGSPLSSLYVRFFPACFERIVTEAPKVASWVNLFRADDYVGKALRLSDACSDKQIDGHGHERYWTDANVLKELEEIVKE